MPADRDGAKVSKRPDHTRAQRGPVERLPCQVCGRWLVPLRSGIHRPHKPPGSREPYYRCPGSGYRAARWSVGQRLHHHTSGVWVVDEDRGVDYVVRCLDDQWGRETGRVMTVHGEYMHRHGWTPVTDAGRAVLAAEGDADGE